MIRSLWLISLFLSSVISAPFHRRESYEGTGTWFEPVKEGGPLGACGPKENNDSMVVALNQEQYGEMGAKSPWCGKQINLQGAQGTVTATINDACPGCSYGDLDLTPAVFKQVIGDLNLGVGHIVWSLA